MMKRQIAWAMVCGLLVCAPAAVFAQLRGMGRVGGVVTDDRGAPLPGVSVKASVQGAGGAIDSTSDAKGEWTVSGMAKGQWHIEFVKPGHQPTAAKVILEAEITRVPPIAISLKKAS